MGKKISLKLPEKTLKDLEEIKEQAGFLNLQSVIRQFVRESLRERKNRL